MKLIFVCNCFAFLPFLGAINCKIQCWLILIENIPPYQLDISSTHQCINMVLKPLCRNIKISPYFQDTKKNVKKAGENLKMPAYHFMLNNMIWYKNLKMPAYHFMLNDIIWYNNSEDTMRERYTIQHKLGVRYGCVSLSVLVLWYNICDCVIKYLYMGDTWIHSFIINSFLHSFNHSFIHRVHKLRSLTGDIVRMHCVWKLGNRIIMVCMQHCVSMFHICSSHLCYMISKTCFRVRVCRRTGTLYTKCSVGIITLWGTRPLQSWLISFSFHVIAHKDILSACVPEITSNGRWTPMREMHGIVTL